MKLNTDDWVTNSRFSSSPHGRFDKIIDLRRYSFPAHGEAEIHRHSPCVKVVKRLKADGSITLQDEITILRSLSECPFIVKLLDVFEQPDYTYVVMERPRGGSLAHRLTERICFSENEARAVMKKILMAAEYAHNRRIAHRNIKLENILLTENETVVDVKLCDFGMAKRVLYPNALTTQCGTEGYLAPEILEHRPEYDVQCDMWSIGVVFYLLLGGYRPFRGDGDELVRKIRYGDYKFHKRYWSEVSKEATALISHMLSVKPRTRITATAALHSDWMVDERQNLSDFEFK